MFDFDFEDNMNKTLSDLNLKTGKKIIFIVENENEENESITIQAYINHHE